MFPKLDELLKNLEDEEFCMRQESVTFTNFVSMAKKVEQGKPEAKKKKDYL